MPARRFIALFACLGAVAGALVSLVWRFLEPPTFGNTYYATARMKYEQFVTEVGDPPAELASRFAPESTLGWLPATAISAAMCGLLFAGSAALACRSRRLDRKSDGAGAPLVMFAAGLGAVTGLLGALAILAVPHGEPLDGVVDRLQTFTPELADADTLWWLLVPGGALLGLLVATAATKLGWRLVRTAPVSQPGSV